jgi:hypothetical protein
MSLERNTDLPANLRNGLNAEQQNMVRGLFNTLVYENNMNPAEAEQMATQMLQTSGMVYDGKWNVVKNEAAVGAITKIDEDKRLVFGWASIIKDTEGKVLLDRQNDFIDSEDELEKSAYTYVLHSRDGGEMHVRKGVSTMVESVVLTKEKQESLGIPAGTVPIGWWIGFRVNDDRVWDEVKKGGYAGFSVHGTGQRNETKLNAGEFTEIEKCDEPAEKPALRVASRYVELLTKAQNHKLSKGEGPGHPFRGNQWTSGRGGRGAPKDPTRGAQGGGSGRRPAKPIGTKGEVKPRGTKATGEPLGAKAKPKPAGKGEYTMSEYGSGRINLRIKESALPKAVLDIHRKAQRGATGMGTSTMHPDKASALKATKDPAQTLVTHYKQVKDRAKEGLLDATGGGMAGKRMRDGLMTTFNDADTALSELAALGYK